MQVELELIRTFDSIVAARDDVSCSADCVTLAEAEQLYHAAPVNTVDAVASLTALREYVACMHAILIAL